MSLIAKWDEVRSKLLSLTAKGNFFFPRIISAEEVKPSSVLKITENDLITATLANSQYVIEEDGTKTTHFDFQTLQRQVIQRFISGRPIIKVQVSLAWCIFSTSQVAVLQASRGCGILLPAPGTHLSRAGGNTNGVPVRLAAHHSASVCIPWIVTVVWSKNTLRSANLGGVNGNVCLSVQSLQGKLAWIFLITKKEPGTI